MKKKTAFYALAIWLMLYGGLFAEENKDKKWNDEAELSYVDTSGNTEVRSLSGKNKLGYQFNDRLAGEWNLSALYGETDGRKIAERYATDGRIDFSVTERLYVAGLVGWLKDEFSGIDQRISIGPAVGYKFLLGPKHFLKSEASLEYVEEDYTNNDEEAFMRAGLYGLYEFLLTEKSRFSQSLEYLYDFEDVNNYNLNSVTAIITSLSDIFSIKTSYEVHYDNAPVPDSLEETDTILSVALVVNF
jgi:putative salt-induced outer membrane protein